MLDSVIDPVVFETLKESAGQDFIGELIQTYLADAPQQIVKLREALAQNNADTFRRTAHSIKSSSANFGARRVVELALALELAGKAGALDGAAAQIARLEEAFQQAAQALQKLGSA